MYFQLSFFVFSYALPLLLIVAMYSLMLYTLLCKVNTNLRRIGRREKPFLAVEVYEHLCMFGTSFPTTTCTGKESYRGGTSLPLSLITLNKRNKFCLVASFPRLQNFSGLKKFFVDQLYLSEEAAQ